MIEGPVSGRAAVIDIGSNSVRLVIYTLWRASALPTFNEKVMAGLGNGLGKTGRLSETGVDQALKALRRYRAILRALDIDRVAAVATAAVRVAEDGPAFVAAAEEAAGAPVKVLSGLDEGRLSARGVATGVHRADGLIGDLGGSSLELHPVGPTLACAGETHMLGPLALDAFSQASPGDIRAHVREVLKSSNALRSAPQTFYAVGGAWRAVGKVHMARTGYPLGVLQNHVMSAKAVTSTTKAILSFRAGKSSGLDLGAITSRRAPTLHLAAIVLDEVVRLSGTQRVVLSSMGLREGVLREMVGEVRGDPLLDGAVAYARLDPAQLDFGRALYAFTAPVFEADAPLFGSRADDARIHRAACLMADSAARFHPDHRADMAYDQALRAPYSAVDHAERAFIAFAVGARYSRNFTAPKPFRALLSEARQTQARRLGLLMRLGAVFSGRSGPILKRVALGRDADTLRLTMERGYGDMMSETVERRLAHAASAFGLAPDVVQG